MRSYTIANLLIKTENILYNVVKKNECSAISSCRKKIIFIYYMRNSSETYNL
jgi:hypothetical protein